MKRRMESDQPEDSRPSKREGPEVDVLRMQVQASFQEPHAGPELQRGLQEESTFLDRIYHLLQYSPGEMEQRLAMGDWSQQSAHREPLPSAQHEAPFPLATEATWEPAKEPVDEAKCHQIVEQLLNPQEKKQLPPLTSDEFRKIDEILERKSVEGVINASVLKKLRRKLQAAKRYKANRETILAQQAQYREGNKAAVQAKNAKYWKKSRETILVKKVQYREENKETIRLKKAEYYEENKETILVKNAKYREENKETILAQQAEYRKRLQDPHERVAFLERTLQQGQDKHDQKRAALEQERQSLRLSGQQASVFEHLARLRQLEEKLTLLEHQWHALRAKKLQALTKAQRLVAIHEERLALFQQAHRHAQPQHAPCSTESLPSWQALAPPEASLSGQGAHQTPSFEEMYQQLSLLLQAPHQADQLQALEHRQREYQALATQLDEELESLLASFQEPDPFQLARLF